MMETMIPPQVGMRLRTLKIKIKEAKEAQIKKEAKEAHQIKQNKTKNERKREKWQCYYPFTTLVLQSSTMFFI